VALAAMAVQGAGNGIFYSALTPLIVQVTDDDRRIHLLSMRYAVNNAGIGLGALAGGFIINSYGRPGYLGVYLANALSFVLFAMAVARLPVTGGTPTTRRGPSPRDYLAALANRQFRRLLVLQLVIVSFGYAQIDSSLPLYVKQHLGMSATAIGGLIAANTAIVTVLQVPAGRFVAARGTRLALRALGGIWLLAMLIGFVAGQLRGAAATVTAFLAVSVFSIGECLYTPGFQPALVHTAGSARLGRHAALASMTWTVALLGAPALGLALVQLPWPPAYWLVLAAAGGVIAVLAAGVADVRERAGNARSRRPDGQEAQPTNAGARREH
jgi:MFS family permease